MITNKNYAAERKLFGAVIGFDPTAMAKDHRHESVKHLGYRVADSIAQVVDYDLGTDYPDDPIILVSSGIRDTYLFLSGCLRPDISLDRRQSIARHPKTLQRLVELAMRTDAPLDPNSGVLNGNIPTSRLSEDANYLAAIDVVPRDEDDGCPFAGNNRSGKVDPLFVSFTAWATELAFAHHDLNSKDSTISGSSL